MTYEKTLNDTDLCVLTLALSAAMTDDQSGIFYSETT